MHTAESILQSLATLSPQDRLHLLTERALNVADAAVRYKALQEIQKIETILAHILANDIN